MHKYKYIWKSESKSACQVTAVSLATSLNPALNPLMTGSPPVGRIDTTQWLGGGDQRKKESIGRPREVVLIH